MLYQELFASCPQFNWVCAFDAPRDLSRDLIARLFEMYGVQVFTDGKTALASFCGIDAVITTWAIPHLAHVKNIHYIALAYEMGLPVFELQHGLFQLGINYSEREAFVGSGFSGALTGLDAPNLTAKKLVWGEATEPDDVSIGYPPFVPSVYESVAYGRAEENIVLIATNLHWNIFNKEDVAIIWDYLYTAIHNLPDVHFILMPHPVEMNSAILKRVLKRFNANSVRNLEIARPQNRQEFIEILEKTSLVISTISTILLDFEMYDKPCILLTSPKQRSLRESFQCTYSPNSKEEFNTQIKEVLYYGSHITLRTGALLEFSPSKLVKAVQRDLCTERLGTSKAVPLISKYLQGIK